jgi:hypothetical protein
MYYKRKANQVRQAGHVILAINPHPLCPFWIVKEQICNLNTDSIDEFVRSAKASHIKEPKEPIIVATVTPPQFSPMTSQNNSP